ncbi:MAG: ArnT family glycosyltransferase [Bacteroidia bacterium]
MRKYLIHPFGIFIILIHAVYFFIAWNNGSIYLVDSYGYLNQVKNILLHQCWYAEDWNTPVLIDYFTIRPPLYAFFILSCKSIYHSDYFVLVIQNLLSIFNIFLIWKLLEKNNVKQKAINTAIVLALIFFPSQMIHSDFVMSEILLQFFLTFAFYFSVKTLDKPELKNIFWVSVCISLAMLTKPVVLFLGVLLAAYFFFIFWRKNTKLLLPFLLIPVTYHLLCLQNQHTTGYYHFTSMKIMADVRVNSRYVLASKYGADSSSKFETQLMNEANLITDYGKRYEFIEQKCNEVYLQNKTAFVKQYVKGMASTMLDPGRFDLGVFFNLQNNASPGFLHRFNTEGIKSVPEILKETPIFILFFLGIILLWNALLSLSLVVFLFDKKIAIRLRIFVVLFIAYFVMVIGISGLCRYRVPFFPMLVFALAFTLDKIITGKKYFWIQKSKKVFHL